MLTKYQAELIAAALNQIRPNDWRPKQVLEVLAANRENPNPFGVILQAAVNAALTPAIKSPAGIFLPGKHWPEQTQEVPPEPPYCLAHYGHYAHNCRVCHDEINDGTRHPSELGKRLQPSPPPANFKDLIQQATNAHRAPRSAQDRETPAQSQQAPQNATNRPTGLSLQNEETSPTTETRPDTTETDNTPHYNAEAPF